MQAQDIEKYLSQLGQGLVNQGIHQPLRVLTIGGAYMMVLANALRSTDDIDIFWLKDEGYSNSLTAVVVLVSFDADKVRKTILEHYNPSLGTGFGGIKGKVFHLGHLSG